MGAALVLTGCTGTSEPDVAAEPAPAATDAEPSAQATPACSPAQVVAAWPLRRQVSQLLFGGIQTDPGADPDPLGTAQAAVADGAVGGLNFLGNNPTVYSDGQLTAVREAAGAIPPFLAIDQEGGRVQRLRDIFGDQPSARVMGATFSPAQVRRLGRQTGEYMAALGFDMDLAPVVDVSAQPDDAVAGDRSFAGNPVAVTRYAGAFADGLRGAGVIPVLKHFPGLGSATGNTDVEPATTPPLDQVRRVDLVPYRTLARDEPVAVMMASAVVPGLTDGQPAGLSKPAVDLLRDDVGFDGVVMTDSLSGAAITDTMTVPEAAERALAAGVDMVLWDSTAEADAIRDRIVSAVRTGRIPAAQIAGSVARVLELKAYDPCPSH